MDKEGENYHNPVAERIFLHRPDGNDPSIAKSPSVGEVEEYYRRQADHQKILLPRIAHSL